MHFLPNNQREKDDLKSELFNTGKMVQEVKATKPNNLSSILRIHTEAKENRLQKVLANTYMHEYTYTHTQTHTQIIIK